MKTVLIYNNTNLEIDLNYLENCIKDILDGNMCVAEPLSMASFHEHNEINSLVGSFVVSLTNLILEVKDKTIYGCINFMDKSIHISSLPPSRKDSSMWFKISDKLILYWNSWNSGGGCMIWSYDFIHSDGAIYSVQVSDELTCLVSTSSDDYWNEDDDEKQEKLHLKEVPYGEDIAIQLCQWTGQELADQLALDIQTIQGD